MSVDGDMATTKDLISYTIEPYSSSIREAFARLFPDEPDKLADVDWRFGPPEGNSAKFAISRKNDEIVGMIALVPTPLQGRFGTLKGFQAIDTVVDPAARGKFIFIRLGKIIHESPLVDADLVWGFPNALAARGWFGKLGWERFGSVPFLIKPFRTGYFLGQMWNPLRHINIPLNWRRPSKDVSIVTELDDRWDGLWARCRDEFGLAVDRSSHWLRWRLEKPKANYRYAMKVGTDGAQAVVITRIAQKHGAMICYVMEALAPLEHRRTLVKLLRSELRRAASNGADLALAWCPKDAPNRQAYSRAGLFGLADRFRPIQIHFGGRWLASGAALGKALLGEQWYLSYLDSDTV